MASSSDFRFFNTPAPPSAYQQAQNTAKAVVSFAEDSGKLMGQKYNLAMQDQQRAARYAYEDQIARQAAAERERKARVEAAAKGDFDRDRYRYTMPGEQARAMDQGSLPELSGMLGRDVSRPSEFAQEFGLGRGFRPAGWSQEDESLLLNAEQQYQDRLRNPSFRDRQAFGVSLSGIDPKTRASEAFDDLRRETDTIAAARRQREDPYETMGKPVIPAGIVPIGGDVPPSSRFGILDREGMSGATGRLMGRTLLGIDKENPVVMPDIEYYDKSPTGNPYNTPKGTRTPEQQEKRDAQLSKIKTADRERRGGEKWPLVNPPAGTTPTTPAGAAPKPAGATPKPAAPAATPAVTGGSRPGTGIPLVSAANPVPPKIATPPSILTPPVEKEAGKTTTTTAGTSTAERTTARQQAAAKIEEALRRGDSKAEEAARAAAIDAGVTPEQIDRFTLRKKAELNPPDEVRTNMQNVERLQGEGFKGLAELYRGQAQRAAGRRPNPGGPRPNLNTRFLTRRAYSRGLEQQFKDNPLLERTFGEYENYQSNMIEQLIKKMEEDRAAAAQAAAEAQAAQPTK